MAPLLTSQDKREFATRGFSRRHFGRLATLISAGAALPFANEFALAQMSMVAGGIPADAVKLNANENPLGPCEPAIEAMYGIVRNGGRYLYEETSAFEKTLAEQEGLRQQYVRAFPGSSLPLHHAVIAFTSPTRPLVVADPGYESAEHAARFIGAKTIKVPLTKTYAHDVRAMAQAHPQAGMFYICNPNNPTGTVTSREDIDYLLAHKPAGSVVMIDEAYLHFAGIAPSSDLVAADKDVIILRTFSKLYGMAGLRAAAVLARPDLTEKLRGWYAGALPTTSMVGANTSLKTKTLVAERRKINADIRSDTLEFIEKHNFKYVPSLSNKFMIDVRRPGEDVISALRREKIYIGRVWPSWPTHVRVSIGTKSDMAKFKTAFLKVMA